MFPVSGLFIFWWRYSFEQLSCVILKPPPQSHCYYADWMMLTNKSNQGEANSVTIAPLAHEILTADATLEKVVT